ncbi:MAG: TetR/AcrR family transcriptional regulator [Ferrimicrobium sp.]
MTHATQNQEDDLSARGRLGAPRRREVVMRAAIAAFAANGYDATSMDDIANRAHVTKPVVYQHFASKKALYTALLDYVGASLIRSIQDATNGELRPHERLRAGIDAYFQFIHDRNDAFALLFGTVPQGDTEAREKVEGTQLAIANLVTSRLTGVDDPTEQRLVAFSLVGLVEGSARAYLSDSLALEDAALPFAASHGFQWARRTTSLLWNGLRTPKPPQPPSEG